MTIALSWSRLSDFQQCPLKFKLKYLDKVENFSPKDGEKNIHLVRGQNVHKALENYVLKRKEGGSVIHSSLPEVNNLLPLVEGYIGHFGIDNIYPEQQICVDDTWCKQDWFSREAYYRAILDFIGIAPDHALVVDYKTGKFVDYTPPNGFGQLELSAAVSLSLWPVESVTVKYLYADHKKQVTKKYNRQDRIDLVEHFEEQHAIVNAELNFEPCKNKFCRWCEATKDQCQFAP